ncbi:unnamed protein product [Closterium sp. NIES-64]|nr:unnamed protein product [Closterium sp. NIES-64]CAI6004590.1 unnamed protein product [Closterium sp. NIES-64]
MDGLFALSGMKDISGVTILMPQQDAIRIAAAVYASHDSNTRKYSQAINDALTLMMEDGNSQVVPQWTEKKSFSPAAAGVLANIWKFQIVKEYIPPSVATQKYSSGDPWELPTLEGQPLWMNHTLHKYYMTSQWNISGASPQQQASSPLTKFMGHVMLDGSPLAYTLVDGEDMLLDVPETGGTAASLSHLLASIGLALTALMLR